MSFKKVTILGTRGIPASHGGFETFAERLSTYLVSRGWKVVVYCQESGAGVKHWDSQWCGVDCRHVRTFGFGAVATMLFDLRSAIDCRSSDGLLLTLGYNTALFNLIQRVRGQVNVFNMDGLEWKRDKWGAAAKLWFWLNERVGCWVGNHLVADHPEIKAHLSTRVNPEKITMIPYGADEVTDAQPGYLDRFGVQPGEFSVVIARAEPENSILEIVRSFSRATRNHKLIVLGAFSKANAFHRLVMDAASNEVVFPGAIYEVSVVQSLRFFSRLYIHGHRVGGTNPSLVEALGAGCAVLAHDNRFNRWVAGPDAAYFYDEASCASLFDSLLKDDHCVSSMRLASRAQFYKRFTWARVLREYEELLEAWLPAR